MSSLDENIDPHSLPKLSHLLSNSAQKRNNKRQVHTRPSPAPGLRESIFSNISEPGHFMGHLDSQLPTPPSSQSMDNKLLDETRLPISPPPEEEIRVKELSAHGHTPKKKTQSRLPVPSRGAPSAAFKFPPPPQSFAQYQQQGTQRPDEAPISITSATNEPATSNANPRKRARSAIVPTSAPSSSKNDLEPAASAAVAESPNPKPRKQPKMHSSGVYTGSGFKRRHTRGTSADSLITDEDALGQPMPPPSTLKSPARKRRTKDSGVEDYTPQREQASKPLTQKARARRSTTPDVRYEPPTEQFTPPRHVVLHPPSSTTSVRSRKPRQSAAQPAPSIERKVVRVKPERLTSPFPLPPIDFSKPTAPPSPTDDPILLVGPPVRARSRGTARKTLVDAAVGEDVTIGVRPQDTPSTPPRGSSHLPVDESMWHMPPDVDETALMNVGFDGPSQFDATFDLASDSDSDDAPPPDSQLVDPDKSTGSHIFHSDDEDAEVGDGVGEDEGEYTGRFKFYSVPVKQDPPSSATRARRDSWGRPISPFPFKRRTSGAQAGADDDGDAPSDDESPPPSPSDGRRRPGTPRHAAPAGSETPTRRGGGFTLSEMEARLEARREPRPVPNVVEGVEAESEDESSVDDEVTMRDDHADEVIPVDNGNACEVVDDDEHDVRSVEREVTPVDDAQDTRDVRDQDDLSEDEVDNSSSDQDNADVQDEDDGGSEDEPVEEVEYNAPGSSRQQSESQAAQTQYTEHVIPLPADEDPDFLIPVDADDSDDGSSGEDVSIDPVVEISSDDPKAAARAAAILKLHHSYILDGVVAKHARRASPRTFARRRSFAFGDGEAQEEDAEHQDMIRRARRKSVANSGGVQQHRARQTSHSPLARSVFVPPGSPAGSAISADDALREAEIEIRAASASPRVPRTPLRPRSLEFELLQSRPASPPAADVPPSQPTANRPEWTKSDWKRLDMCFTDERIAVAEARELDTQMAEVHDVDIDAVVDRFIDGESTEWDREMLLRRATALCARQRAGKGAPPSPRRLNFGRSRSTDEEIDVPVFTPPIARSFVPPSDICAPMKLPPSLLAPRYAHLHEEAAVNTVEQPSTPRAPDADIPQRGEKVVFPAQAHPSTPPPADCEDAASDAPASATKRVLSYLGSFLGRGATAKPANPVLRPTFRGLPLPPPEMRQTARGPVSTPAKKALPKSQAPRELVQLAETQVPPKPVLPRAKSAREMVSLNHVDPPRSVQRPRTTSVPIVIPGRARADSGGSVRDLVRSFEQVQKKTEEEMARSTGSRGASAVRKAVSIGNLTGKAPWKP